MRRLLLSTCFWLAAAWGVAASPKIVLELYSSQACAQSPAADTVLSRLAGRPDIIALSMPVSYWNYLGWKDTLARDAHNKRQLTHAAYRRDRLIYTPQLVINGRMQTNGAIETLVHAIIKQTAREIAAVSVPVSISTAGDELVVSVDVVPDDSPLRTGDVWLAMYSTSVVVNIDGGENSGHRMIYRNVVRQLVKLGAWQGTPARFTLPRGAAFADGRDGVAALLQSDDTGAIIGAEKLEQVASN